MRTKKNILYHTFIGLPVEVVQSSMRSLVGIKGKVIDETKGMLVIETARGEKKVQKVSCVFRFTCDNGDVVDIKGEKICFRPEERPKKV